MPTASYSDSSAKVKKAQRVLAYELLVVVRVLTPRQHKVSRYTLAVGVFLSSGAVPAISFSKLVSPLALGAPPLWALLCVLMYQSQWHLQYPHVQWCHLYHPHVQCYHLYHW
eukprot:4747443-Amphidinium_carterae.1